MHTLQPKHLILKPADLKELLESYNISISQLPKIKQTDPGLPADSPHGAVVKIERKDADGKLQVYYRVIA